MSAQLIKSVREQRFTPTFKILSENVTVTSDACVVEMIVQIQHDQYVITGSARRAKGDRSDYEVGYYVAVSRAYDSLAKKLQRRAAGLVRHHDDVQKRQQAAKDAAKAPVRTVARSRSAVAKKTSKAVKKTKSKTARRK